MKELKMVVVSHVSVQSFNTLSFLSVHIPGRDLGVKGFSVLHFAVTSSVQRFRSCWSDFILFEVFSGQKIYVWWTVQGESQCYSTVHDRWFSSQFSTFNSVLHLSRAALQLLLLNETKDYIPVCFPFLLSSVLLGVCFIRQCTVTTGSCCSPALEVPRQLPHFCVFELRLFTLLGTASHGLLPLTGFSIPAVRFSRLSSGPSCLSVVCFPAILCLTFLSLSFCLSKMIFPS